MSTPRQFVADADRRVWIDQIRERLRNRVNQCQVFRVIGLPGIGKTRFVFEALSPHDLRSHVVYVKADKFRLSNLYYTLQNDPNRQAIVVVDECDLHQHDEFVRGLSNRGERLALVTLYHDRGAAGAPTQMRLLSRLGQNELKEIIKLESRALPEDVATRLARFADGYPRIAIVLAQAYRSTGASSDEFLQISDDALFERLIAGRLNTSSGPFATTKAVLAGLSLFEKIGYEGPPSEEAKWLAGYLEVSWKHFRQVVGEQKRRGIIQGQYYIYVTPFMLRVHLLREWWETEGLTMDTFNELVKSIPEPLRADLTRRFLEHIPYITSTERGRQFAEDVLSANGPFSDGSALKDALSASFFLKLAEADAKSGLDCLKRTVGTWTREELLSFTTGRNEVAWALQMIAMWRDLFPGAARLLLALAETDTEAHSSTASQIFVSLFSPAPAPVAPTEAPPKERLTVLSEALRSHSKQQRLLALEAIDHALETQSFMRIGGAEDQGLRREPRLWRPKTYAELFDAYRAGWHLLETNLDTLSDDEREKAVDVLLGSARGLCRIPYLSDMVLTTLGQLSRKAYVDDKTVLSTVARILHYDGKDMLPELRKRLEHLKDSITGDDFASLMRRYVGMDLLEDHFDEDGKVIDQVQPRLEELGKKAVEDMSLLQHELDWLVTNDAQKGYQFGYELGRADSDFKLLPRLLEAQQKATENASVAFLGGYFRALFEKDQRAWEAQLDALSEDRELSVWVPELTWRSGMTDQAALRILSLAQDSKVDIGKFGMFALGSVINELSPGLFDRWIDFLLSSGQAEGVSIALSLYHFYYVHKEPKSRLPEALTLRLLLQQLSCKKPEGFRTGVMDDYSWTQIAKLFVHHYPEKSLGLAEEMLKHFGEDGTVLESFMSQAQVVLNTITADRPQEVWQKITRHLGPPIDSRAFHLKQWLRGGKFYEEEEGAITLIPHQHIWDWVDQDVEKRAWYVASFVSPCLSTDSWKDCLARQVLVRYGTRKDVRQNLMANFSTEGWSDSAAAHYERKKQELLEIKKEETDPNVILWIDDYISLLNADIDRARIEEERTGY